MTHYQNYDDWLDSLDTQVARPEWPAIPCDATQESTGLRVRRLALSFTTCMSVNTFLKLTKRPIPRYKMGIIMAYSLYSKGLL